MTCDACCREFTGRSADCPHCGYNNGRRGGPRSARSLAETDRRRREREEFEQELAELTEEFGTWLRWNEAAEKARMGGKPHDR